MNFHIAFGTSQANCEQITGAVLRIRRSYGVKFQQQIQTIVDFLFSGGRTDWHRFRAQTAPFEACTGHFPHGKIWFPP